MVFINDFELVKARLHPNFELVRCGMPQEFPEGLHELEMHVTGYCNQTFVQEKGIRISLPANTTCEYVTPLMLYVWTERSVKWKVFGIVGGVLGLAFVVFLGWCCFKNCRLERKYQHLSE